MILLVILTCLIGMSHQLPYQQLQYQNSPMNWIYPGLRQSISYRPYPIIATYPMNNMLSQNYNLQTNPGITPAFKQGFPGNIISAIPFIPFHINIPDIVGTIIKGFQSVFGPVPIIQQNTDQLQNGVQNIVVSPNQVEGMTPIGMIDKNTMMDQNMPLAIPMPIIIVVPAKQDEEPQVENA